MVRIQLDPEPEDIVKFLKEREGVVSVNPTNLRDNDGILDTKHVRAQYYSHAYIGEKGLRLVVVQRLSDKAVKSKDTDIHDHLQSILNPKFDGKDPFADAPAIESKDAVPVTDITHN